MQSMLWFHPASTGEGDELNASEKDSFSKLAHPNAKCPSVVCTCPRTDMVIAGCNLFAPKRR